MPKPKKQRKRPYKELSSALHVNVKQRSQAIPSKKEKQRRKRTKARLTGDELLRDPDATLDEICKAWFEEAMEDIIKTKLKEHLQGYLEGLGVALSPEPTNEEKKP